MPITATQRRAYLDRIGFTGVPEADLPTLRRLQRQHLLSVPFENLSIHRGEPIVLDVEQLFDKIVTRRRGGFCYECNGLFHTLLRDLGFAARLISARVRDGRGGFGPEFDHMAIIVEFDEEGPHLVDVGFGKFAAEPLPLEIGQDLRVGDTVYRIVRHGMTHFRVTHATRNAPYEDDYLFSLLAQDLEDFEEMCRYHQTSPDSPFTKKRLCSLVTLDGRLSLTDEKFVVTRLGKREETAVTGEAEFREQLHQHFGISIG